MKTSMDSTCAILRLWHLTASHGPQQVEEGVVSVIVLRDVLERGLQDKLVSLQRSSVDEIIWDYLKPDTEGIVGFFAVLARNGRNPSGLWCIYERSQ